MEDSSPSLALARTLGALCTTGVALERQALLPTPAAPSTAPKSPPSIAVAAVLGVACLLAGFLPAVFLGCHPDLLEPRLGTGIMSQPSFTTHPESVPKATRGEEGKCAAGGALPPHVFQPTMGSRT